jgi:hypothetical protein
MAKMFPTVAGPYPATPNNEAIMTTNQPAAVGENSGGNPPSLPEPLRSPKSFDIEVSRARHNAIMNFCDQFLRDGEDYQKLDYSNRPTLLAPGAQKLAIFCGLEPRITLKDETLDWTGKDHGGEPFFYAMYRWTMYLDGKAVGEGEGSCNSWEIKYRYRWVQESQLSAHLDKSKLVTKGGRLSEFEFAVRKAETAGKYGKPASYWKMFEDAKANGTASVIDKEKRDGTKETAIEIDATMYRIPNNDVAEVVNTVQKMGQKRGHICAVIQATGVSSRFTQDVDDMDPSNFDQKRGSETNKPTPETKKTAPETKPAKAEPEPTRTERSTRPAKSDKSNPPAQQQNQPQPQPTQKSDADRLPRMRASFQELKAKCPPSWFRRRLNYTEIDSLELADGITLYKTLDAFVTAVGVINDLKQKLDKLDRDIFGRTLYSFGVSEPWDCESVENLQQLASLLEEQTKGAQA